MSLSVITRTRDEIIHLHDELGGLVAKSVELVWRIGQNLREVKARLDHGQFLPWVEENLPFSHRTANNYLSVFERYPAGLPDGMTLSQAYIEAGVKKLAKNEDEAEKARPEPVMVAQRDWGKDWARLKNTPTHAVPLNRYRVVVNPASRVIHALRENHHEPIPVAGILLTPKPGSEEVWAEFYELLHCATEEFLAKIEALEEEGVIDPPEDHSVFAKHQKAKKIAKGGKRVHQ